MRDGKVITIIVLSILVLGFAIFAIATHKELRKTKRIVTVDFTKQEKKYKNETPQNTVNYNHERYFRSENRHLYKHAHFFNNVLYRKATLYFDAGQYQEALKIFLDMKSSTMNPESSSAYYYHIAQCLVNLKRDKKALFFLNKVMQRLRPNTWTTKAIILQGQINRKYQFTNESLEVYLHKLYMETASPTQRAEILTQLGYLKLFRNKLDSALDHFQKAHTPLAQLGQARVFVRKNLYWKAVSIYENMLKHKNFSNISYYKDVKRAFLKQTYYYAKQWMNRKDYDHAYFYFRKIVNFFPNSIYGESSLFWISEIFFNRRIYRTAIKYYNMALSNGNRNKDAAAQYKKGIALYHLKRFASAIRNLSRVTRYHKGSGYYQRAQQWIKMSQREIMYK